MTKVSDLRETGSFLTLRNLTHNHFLAALPKGELDQLAPHLQLVALPVDHAICEAGDQLLHVWFPTSAIVSLHCVVEGGANSEIAAVGNEGVFGLPLFMGVETSSTRAVVQSAGYGFRLDAQWVREKFAPGPAFTSLLLRYSEAMFTQTALSWACNRYHRVEQQLSRWLLLNIDRMNGDELATTCDHIANALGVERERLAAAANQLTQARLIEIGPGHIRISDRTGLEKRACNCYAVTKRAFDRLIPRVTLSEHN